MEISFSPSFNQTQAAEDYQKDSRSRIENIFNDDTAQALRASLLDTSQFRHTFVQNNAEVTASDEELNNLDTSKRKEIVDGIFNLASEGVGFFYGKKKLTPETTTNRYSIQWKVYEWLNQPETIEMINKVTGRTDIVSANAQATQYLPGHFLTRHNDVNFHEERRVAYVLNFTDEWHPDWGGLLQFYTSEGEPKDSWAPIFNSMILFDTRHVHAVTYVAPYAQHARVAITGWFCAK